MGTQNGAGIVGTIDGEWSFQLPGKYAGYFKGNVWVTGTINGVTLGVSDLRFKQNVSELNTESTLKNVLQMQPIEYNLKQMYSETATDSGLVRTNWFNEKSQMFQKKHYGLIAQDLQKLYPDLVYEEDNGYLSVNYTGIIPLLIESIKELKAEIDDLRRDRAMQRAGQNTTDLPASTGGAAALFQNSPNPFSQSTQINYYLPQSVNAANLCIYDLQGKQLKRYALSQRGTGSQTISGSEFSAGIYLYALIADGKEVDVKRMILTE
jgi:hypothetical protein